MLSDALIRKFVVMSLACLLALPAHAEDVGADKAQTLDMPAVSSNQSALSTPDVILKLTQDRSEMLKLSQEAASVIVGNPNHISVLLDTPDTIIVVPRMAGTSHFSVIGKDGSVIMQRQVIVGSPKEQYVRIRRSCSDTDRGCQPTSVYYCPDICHEVSENTEGPNTSGRAR